MKILSFLFEQGLSSSLSCNKREEKNVKIKMLPLRGLFE